MKKISLTRRYFDADKSAFKKKTVVIVNAKTSFIIINAENKKNTKIICSRENKMILLTFFSRSKKIVQNNMFVTI